MKATAKQIKEIAELHAEKGCNAVYGYIKRNNIDCKITTYEFGLNTNQEARVRKTAFLTEKVKRTLRFHRYNRLVTSRRTHYSYNVLRGIEFVF